MGTAPNTAKRSEVSLATGSGLEVSTRPLRAADRELLVRGFAGLSDESRYKRFFTPMPELGGSVLDALVAVDQHDHLALGAVDPLHGRRGVGVVRAIRSKELPTHAEFAITVVDEYQRQGVASLLLAALAAVALDHGITTFEGDVLATNRGMRAAISHLGGTIEPIPGDRTVVKAYLPCAVLADRIDPAKRTELIAQSRPV